MAGKRVGLAIASGLLTLLGTMSPKGDLEYIVAQDAKPMADTSKEDHKIALSTNQQFSQNFYTIGEDFYKKAKDKDKALESLGIAAYFDPQNKQITDLIQKVDKDNKLKKNEKESKKIEEKYTKTKNETIETLYQNGVEKAKTSKDEAQDIFYTILQIDKNSTKFDEALEKELNWKKIDGYLLPPEIVSAREKGMKYLNDASEGEQDKTEDDLVTTLKIENDKIYRRKSKYLNVRDTLSEESAKECHKIADATIRLLMEYLELEGKPPYNIYRDPKSTTQYPYHRITIIENSKQFDEFKKSVGRPDASAAGSHEVWKLDKGKDVYGFGHFHNFIEFKEFQKDIIAHSVLEDILYRSSHYVGTETDMNSSWIYRFVCYNLTSQLLGTTLSISVINKDSKYSGGEEATSNFVDSPIKMRMRAYKLVNDKKSVSSNRLIRLKSGQFSDDDSAMAFAGAEYLIHEHKDKLVELLSDAYKEKKSTFESIYDLKSLIGMTPEEFDKGRDEFIKRKYVGLRNYKN